MKVDEMYASGQSGNKSKKQGQILTKDDPMERIGMEEGRCC